MKEYLIQSYSGDKCKNGYQVCITEYTTKKRNPDEKVKLTSKKDLEGKVIDNLEGLVNYLNKEFTGNGPYSLMFASNIENKDRKYVVAKLTEYGVMW